METITISGREFQYEIFWYDGEYGDYAETVFYQGTKTETKHKYLLFGPMITVEAPIQVFKFSGSIKSIDYTKKQLREKLEKKVELIDRQAEIDRGELI
jgi:hypothetical protein